MKAWFCWIPRYGGSLANGKGAMVRATTRSKARYLAYLSALDPLPDLCLIDIKVRREKAYDRAEFRDGVMPRYAEFPDKKASS